MGVVCHRCGCGLSHKWVWFVTDAGVVCHRSGCGLSLMWVWFVTAAGVVCHRCGSIKYRNGCKKRNKYPVNGSPTEATRERGFESSSSSLATPPRGERASPIADRSGDCRPERPRRPLTPSRGVLANWWGGEAGL